MFTKEMLKSVAEYLEIEGVSEVKLGYYEFMDRVFPTVVVKRAKIPVKCPVCKGSSNQPGSSAVPCTACSGKGYIFSD